jgi:hypothetical protein
VSPAAGPVVTPAPKAPKSVADVVSLPSTKRCVSRRKFSIRLRVPKGSPVTSASVAVNGKQVTVRRGTRLRSTVNLRNLPKGRFSVKIVLKLTNGRKVTGTRRYRTCTAKRHHGKKGPKV